MLSNIERAKQFLPFDALNGLNEALREKEIEYVSKIELTDESKEEISNLLLELEIGSIVEVKYYSFGKYINIAGKIKKINSINKNLIITNLKDKKELKIFFSEILYLNKIF